MPILDSIKWHIQYTYHYTHFKNKILLVSFKSICDKSQRQMSKFIYVAKKND